MNGSAAMWIRNLVKLRERYSGNQLPTPLQQVARACWKIVGKPIVNASLDSLSKRQHFFTSSNWEWRRNLLLGLHEEETVALCNRLLLPGMTVLDIGAHVGYFTRQLSHLVGPRGKVYAFEPNPQTFALLRANTARLTNVVLVNKAVSATSGTRQLYLHELEAADSLFRPADALPAIAVGVISLDDFWRQAGEPRVDFIKMDVEGAEPSVLAGAEQFLRAQKHLRMVTEFRPESLRAAGISPAEFLRSLSKLGFRYGAIGAQGELLSEVPRLEGQKYINLYCEKLFTGSPQATVSESAFQR